MVETGPNIEKAGLARGDEVLWEGQQPGIRRELSFSGWCDENGVFHPDQLENGDAEVEDFHFELSLVQQSRSKNGILNKGRQAFGKFKQKMEGIHARDMNRHTVEDESKTYVPFDVESDSRTVEIESENGFSNNINHHEALNKTSRSVVSVADVLKTIFFILVWYTFSTFLTLYNKTLLGDDMGKFPAPLLMNTVHFTMQAVLSKAITWFWSHRFQPTVVMSWRDYFLRVVPTALSTAMDVNLSNASLVFISVTFATMCKSASPIFLLIFAFAFRLESPSFKLFGIMLIISVGILFTVAKETEFDFWGFIFVMLAAVMSGFRWTMTQILLQKEDYGLKNPLTLMSYVTPVMAIATAFLSLLLDPWHKFRSTEYFDSSWHMVRSGLLMLFGGTLAFFMVLTEYILVSVTSAVTVTIAGVVKEAVTILVAVFYFHDEFTFLKGVGLVTILFGVSLFNWYKYQKLQKDGSLTNSVSYISMPSLGFPQVVWSANRNNPVKINASLQLTSGGDLVLRDADGTLAWSTNTAGKSVAGLNLTESGNLVLFDHNNSVVWQSFDYPTDALVPGQTLVPGQKLRASVSPTNSSDGGLFSVFVNSSGLFAVIESNPPQSYYQVLATGSNNESNYVKFQNGSLALYVNSSQRSDPYTSIPLPPASSAQYMRLGSDGHLRLYEWQSGWNEIADIFTGYLGECNYPMVCGQNGICSNGQCSCPRSSNDSTSYFQQISARQPNLGCSANIPLACDASRYHVFEELQDVTYFTFNADISNTDMDRCKQSCLRNCACKAAIFRYGSNASNGDCYLPSQVFSLMNNEKDKTHYNSSVFMKVQITPNVSTPAKAASKGSISVKVILGCVIGAFVVLCFGIGLTVFIVQKKRRRNRDIEEDYLDNVPGMPTRFPFEDLKTATDDFSKKLGQGGFGSVFEGVLKDGTRVAVKCLDGIGQVKKSFLAEVETIGNVHHVNLVRLVGFCAEKSHRLLVYEYMSNGSLEKWIYKGGQEISLDWKSRRRIVLDIAKGLAYLHEDCRQKIIHLDIKPQNILLDEKDQSQVVTTMRGTPGYLAPEWLSSIITEKVDVYSFGVVMLEILCGRKILDRSEPDERMHLLNLFKKKAEEKNLSDMIDHSSEDMQSNKDEAMELMRVAAWCLQSDYTSRPSMSVVVKVLEGFMKVADVFSGSMDPKEPNHGCSANIPLSCNASQYHSLRIMPEDLAPHGQRTFDTDSFGYDRLGEIAQVAERALSVNATNVSSLDGQSIHYTSNFLSSMFEGVAGQHQPDDPAGGERESQGEDEAEDADQDDQFEGQGYQRHEEQGSSQTLGTPPLAVSKGQRVTKEPDRLTYSYFRAKKPKKK
ncbi:OLC1v1023626C1 [Oldenlandia corymbosa var. corymbosa]|uniref:non-specific serine/threonine protein kinase n=1 Tax=Oldenlandia corymbosa var. corymbosa TaxID=529605 RepID=A0AAV1C403_OLDCO|nr:OLC1v1023626C1 [Oldenlandia corymbosa var. corymbosa]